MPLYEYTCKSCEQPSELLVRGEEKPVCPNCGSEELVKLLSVVAAPGRSATGGEPAGQGHGCCGSGCCCHSGH